MSSQAVFSICLFDRCNQFLCLPGIPLPCWKHTTDAIPYKQKLLLWDINQCCIICMRRDIREKAYGYSSRVEVQFPVKFNVRRHYYDSSSPVSVSLLLLSAHQYLPLETYIPPIRLPNKMHSRQIRPFRPGSDRYNRTKGKSYTLFLHIVASEHLKGIS